MVDKNTLQIIFKSNSKVAMDVIISSNFMNEENAATYEELIDAAFNFMANHEYRIPEILLEAAIKKQDKHPEATFGLFLAKYRIQQLSDIDLRSIIFKHLDDPLFEEIANVKLSPSIQAILDEIKEKSFYYVEYDQASGYDLASIDANELKAKITNLIKLDKPYSSGLMKTYLNLCISINPDSNNIDYVRGYFNKLNENDIIDINHNIFIEISKKADAISSEEDILTLLSSLKYLEEADQKDIKQSISNYVIKLASRLTGGESIDNVLYLKKYMLEESKPIIDKKINDYINNQADNVDSVEDIQRVKSFEKYLSELQIKKVNARIQDYIKERTKNLEDIDNIKDLYILTEFSSEDTRNDILTKIKEVALEKINSFKTLDDIKATNEIKDCIDEETKTILQEKTNEFIINKVNNTKDITLIPELLQLDIYLDEKGINDSHLAMQNMITTFASHMDTLTEINTIKEYYKYLDEEHINITNTEIKNTIIYMVKKSKYELNQDIIDSYLKELEKSEDKDEISQLVITHALKLIENTTINDKNKEKITNFYNNLNDELKVKLEEGFVNYIFDAYTNETYKNRLKTIQTIYSKVNSELKEKINALNSNADLDFIEKLKTASKEKPKQEILLPRKPRTHTTDTSNEEETKELTKADKDKFKYCWAHSKIGRKYDELMDKFSTTNFYIKTHDKIEEFNQTKFAITTKKICHKISELKLFQLIKQLFTTIFHYIWIILLYIYRPIAKVCLKVWGIIYPPIKPYTDKAGAWLKEKVFAPTKTFFVVTIPGWFKKKDKTPKEKKNKKKKPAKQEQNNEITENNPVEQPKETVENKPTEEVKQDTPTQAEQPKPEPVNKAVTPETEPAVEESKPEPETTIVKEPKVEPEKPIEDAPATEEKEPQIIEENVEEKLPSKQAEIITDTSANKTPSIEVKVEPENAEELQPEKPLDNTPEIKEEKPVVDAQSQPIEEAPQVVEEVKATTPETPTCTCDIKEEQVKEVIAPVEEVKTETQPQTVKDTRVVEEVKSKPVVEPVKEKPVKKKREKAKKEKDEAPVKNKLSFFALLMFGVAFAASVLIAFRVVISLNANVLTILGSYDTLNIVWYVFLGISIVAIVVPLLLKKKNIIHIILGSVLLASSIAFSIGGGVKSSEISSFAPANDIKVFLTNKTVNAIRPDFKQSFLTFKVMNKSAAKLNNVTFTMMMKDGYSDIPFNYTDHVSIKLNCNLEPNTEKEFKYTINNNKYLYEAQYLFITCNVAFTEYQFEYGTMPGANEVIKIK